ncbi:MAG: nucleoside deaminase [Pirellulaceae bacterium]
MAQHEHERFMRRCIELAKVARSNNNTAVGSIIVRDNEVIGEGIEGLPTGEDITAHAETIACREAVRTTGEKLLRGATLYTTAEPCFMCSYVIRQAEISLVVYGQPSPLVGGVTSSHPILVDAALDDWKPAPQVLDGILLDQCLTLRPGRA